MVTENSVRAGNAKISSACRHSLLEKLIEGNRAAAMQRRSGSQSGECREEFGVARDEIALVHKTNGSYRRRGPTELSGMALVSVMKSSDLRNHDDAPTFWLLHGSRLRSVLGQRQMGSGASVVDKVTL